MATRHARAPQRIVRIGRGAVLTPVLLIAALAAWGLSAIAWVSGLSSRGGLARAQSACRAGGQTDFLTDDDKSSSEAASGEEQHQPSKPIEDLKVGMVVDGKVAAKTTTSILVDIGYGEKAARVLAPKKEAQRVLKKVNQEVKGMTVETITNQGVRVSVPGLPKLRLVEDFKVGEAVEGKIVGATTRRLDISAELLAEIKGDPDDVKRLSEDDRLKGVKVEEVDLEKRLVWVTVPGLAELVADREMPETKEKPETRPKPKTRPRRKGSKPKAQDVALGKRVQRVVLNGSNLQGDGSKIRIELRGGLAFDSVGESGEITLVAK